MAENPVISYFHLRCYKHILIGVTILYAVQDFGKYYKYGNGWHHYNESVINQGSASSADSGRGIGEGKMADFPTKS